MPWTLDPAFPCAAVPTCVTDASALAARAAAASFAVTMSCTMPLMPMTTVFIRNSAAFLYLKAPLGTLTSYASRNLQGVLKGDCSYKAHGKCAWLVDASRNQLNYTTTHPWPC
jgi:hypothetical protein